MQYHNIELHTNRYLVLAWLVFYSALGWVIGLLPLGPLAAPVYIILVLVAAFSLLSRVFMLWPEAPEVLECLISEHGQVQLGCDQMVINRWWFAWCSRRLIVLMVFFDPLPLCWLPRFIFWLSPHNTDAEIHRHMRIVARFGHRLPLQYADKPRSTATKAAAASDTQTAKAKSAATTDSEKPESAKTRSGKKTN